MRGAGAAVVGTAILASTVACSDGAQDDDAAQPDPLAAHATRARRDAAAATAAIAQNPTAVDTLTVIADQRTAHAEALDTEVARLTPPPTVSGTAAAATRTAEPEQVPAPALTDLSASLSDAGRSAADDARALSGYRAGLLGSISAACTLASAAVAG
ncbi:hypothetical protein HQ325_19905 [Rhodococcus sp. BP-349]|nr:hypothetical protein [Rhodococcus sp. BP-363]MBY6545036.1 hypothetical protein [Rhodococcus sp. BP-369]MBY6564266.1 hypothetical protein [Rhodococcus sp. BP-370]MBY6578797.1 hypothetical protein [Rhodococcus sp. BP-364]MBY6588098.1 hypothetical protein [Rhodococcus sp. BP-358]MBY6592435.1 hypothetical protein [Rhodococcus sp. BP-362]MBY6596533.1 hypothetical protein [Rhodococcus sp. BP-359]MBY6600872.1 hypothetical protein [Rhodococcus sp. BP-353]MBY6605448.1 hypothetical protein [Rhodoc